MRLLLLALAILVFIPQVTPAYRGKKCSQNTGRCKKTCGTNEAIKGECKNRRVCCVPSVPQKKMPVIVPTRPNPSPMDFIVTVKRATTNFEINMDLEDGNSAATATTSSKLVTASQLPSTPGGRVTD